MVDYGTLLAWGLFGLVYLALALGYLPFFRMDRTGAVFIGALAAMGTGLLSIEESFAALEYRTLLLLFNMMVIVSYFVNSGVFSRALGFLEKVENPLHLLWATVLVSGLSSALFINDVVCLVLTPVVADIVLARRLNPLPYLLAVAMASNIGSAMTPIGNPQNMYIASVSGVSWGEFVWRIFPLSALGLVLLGLLLSPMVKGGEGATSAGHHHHTRRRDLVRAVAVLAAAVAGFWAGFEPAVVTGLGAAFLLLTRHIPRKRIFALVDWDLLVMFASLFVVMAVAAKFGVVARVFAWLEPLGIGTSAGFSGILAVMSNIVGNVPAVVFLSPMVEQMGGGHDRFLLMAAVGTFAGNLTLVGSIANLIVAEKAKAKGIEIGFWAYTKAGAAVTLALCLASMVWF